MVNNDDYCFPSTSALSDERTSTEFSTNFNKYYFSTNFNYKNENCSANLQILSKKYHSKTTFSWKINYGFRLLLMMTIFLLTTCPTIVLSDISSFSNHERDLMKKIILKKFGLEEMYGVKNSLQENNQNIPFYIWDFYDRAKNGELELVRHYLPQMVTHDSNPETQGWFVVYNLSATGRKSENELVVKADLRLRFGKEIPTADEYRQKNIIEDDEEDEPALMTTSWEKYNIYEVDPELREIRRLLDSRFIPEDSLRTGDRWIDFDVTASLSRRRRGDNQETVEYYVERVPADHVPMFIDLRDSAALIVQIETPSSGGIIRHRSKRETKRKKGKKRKQNHSMPKAQDLCRLESLWIDFKDLDWDGWIISPSGYQAYQCRGKCTDMPPSAKQNYTNHAVMQSLIHSLNQSVVPPPCCIPTEMSSLSILFRDQRNITVVHSYPQMIVDACGCH